MPLRVSLVNSTLFDGFQVDFLIPIFSGKELEESNSAPILSACALTAAFLATAITQPADVLRSSRQLSIGAQVSDISVVALFIRFYSLYVCNGVMN